MLQSVVYKKSEINFSKMRSGDRFCHIMKKDSQKNSSSKEPSNNIIKLQQDFQFKRRATEWSKVINLRLYIPTTMIIDLLVNP